MPAVAMSPKAGAHGELCGTLAKTHAVFPPLEARNGRLKVGAVKLGQQAWDKLAAWVEENAR